MALWHYGWLGLVNLACLTMTCSSSSGCCSCSWSYSWCGIVYIYWQKCVQLSVNNSKSVVVRAAAATAKNRRKKIFFSLLLAFPFSFSCAAVSVISGVTRLRVLLFSFLLFILSFVDCCFLQSINTVLKHYSGHLSACFSPSFLFILFK